MYLYNVRSDIIEDMQDYLKKTRQQLECGNCRNGK